MLTITMGLRRHGTPTRRHVNKLPHCQLHPCHLEKGKKTRVNNHLKLDFVNQKQRRDIRIKCCFANTHTKTKDRSLLSSLAFLWLTRLWYHFCHTRFCKQNQVLIVCMPRINCFTHKDKKCSQITKYLE
jgi:hypothetical protein